MPQGVVADSDGKKSRDLFLLSYQALLQKYTTSGTRQGIDSVLVDYRIWRNDRHHKKALDALKTSVTPQTHTEALAYLINVYNFLFIDAIGQNDPIPRNVMDAGPPFGTVWRDYTWVLGGESVTLQYLKDDLLRKVGDPRILFALHEGGLSSPDLKQTPYSGPTLNDDLTQQTKIFLSNHTKGLVFLENENMRLSGLFKRYKNDFGGENRVPHFITGFVDKGRVPDIISEYMTYNWNLNQR